MTCAHPLASRAHRAVSSRHSTLETYLPSTSHARVANRTTRRVSFSRRFLLGSSSQLRVLSRLGCAVCVFSYTPAQKSYMKCYTTRASFSPRASATACGPHWRHWRHEWGRTGISRHVEGGVAVKSRHAHTHTTVLTVVLGRSVCTSGSTRR